MYLGRTRERHKKRINRNFIIITVGFAIVAIMVAYALQHIMLRSMSMEKTEHILHCEIENQSSQLIPCKITLGDVILFEDTVQIGKSSFEKQIHSSVPKNIIVSYGEKSTEIQNVVVQDSISYLMIQMMDSSIVKAQFFE